MQTVHAAIGRDPHLRRQQPRESGSVERGRHGSADVRVSLSSVDELTQATDECAARCILISGRRAAQHVWTRERMCARVQLERTFV